MRSFPHSFQLVMVIPSLLRFVCSMFGPQRFELVGMLRIYLCHLIRMPILQLLYGIFDTLVPWVSAWRCNHGGIRICVVLALSMQLLLQRMYGLYSQCIVECIIPIFFYVKILLLQALLNLLESQEVLTLGQQHTQVAHGIQRILGPWQRRHSRPSYETRMNTRLQHTQHVFGPCTRVRCRIHMPKTCKATL